jgi:hypothetical protein
MDPRTLHFTNNELILECLSGITCECSDDIEMPRSLTRSQNWWPKFWTQLSLQSAGIRWRYVIESYTQMDLSVKSDVFPALQGLAKMMLRDLGFYLAGLWSRTIQHNLTWHAKTEDKHDRNIRTIEWRAPTWSWASTTERIGWMRHMWVQQKDEHDLPMLFITIVNVVTSPIAEDATGQLTSGELILRGRCLSGRIHYLCLCQSSTTKLCLHIRCSETELCVSV